MASPQQNQSRAVSAHQRQGGANLCGPNCPGLTNQALIAAIEKAGSTNHTTRLEGLKDIRSLVKGSKVSEEEFILAIRKEESPLIKETILGAFVGKGLTEKSIPLLDAILSSPSPDTFPLSKTYAALLLGDIKSPSSLAVLNTTFLREKGYVPLSDIAKGIARNQQSGELLLEVINSENTTPAHKDAAFSALAHCQSPSVDKLMIERKINPKYSLTVIEYFRNKGGESSVNHLVDIAEKGLAHQRSKAFGALNNLENTDKGVEVVKGYASRNDERLEVRLDAISALGFCHKRYENDVRIFLGSLQNDTNPQIKEKAAEILGSL